MQQTLIGIINNYLVFFNCYFSHMLKIIITLRQSSIELLEVNKQLKLTSTAYFSCIFSQCHMWLTHFNMLLIQLHFIQFEQSKQRISEITNKLKFMHKQFKQAYYDCNTEQLSYLAKTFSFKFSNNFMRHHRKRSQPLAVRTHCSPFDRQS